MRPLYSVLFCMSLFLGCQTEKFDGLMTLFYKNTVPLIKTEELIQKMQYQQPLLLDTRTRSEFSGSHLP